jgi:hypothetical protein
MPQIKYLLSFHPKKQTKTRFNQICLILFFLKLLVLLIVKKYLKYSQKSKKRDSINIIFQINTNIKVQEIKFLY